MRQQRVAAQLGATVYPERAGRFAVSFRRQAAGTVWRRVRRRDTGDANWRPVLRFAHTSLHSW
jgi:hypothetical protein